jgi:16S rRNA (cytosine967-C5)-methyltransferase
LRSRPEILLKVSEQSVQELVGIQRAILRTALSAVRPGGRLVYAVCSVLDAEGPEVVRTVSDLAEPAPFDAPAVIRRYGSDTSEFRLLPSVDGTDGFYCASLRRL